MKIANKIALSFLAVSLILSGIAAVIFYVVAKENTRKSLYNDPAAALISIFILFAAPIAAWLLGLTAAGLIVRPIEKLRRGVEIANGGDLDHKVDIDAKDEVGQLSKVFNRMTDGLKHTTTSVDALNKEIAARKRSEEEIKKAQDALQAKNEELKKLNQIKSDFISTVSHELRTPLSITKEGISLILDRVVGDINERQSDILTTSRNNIDRLARIINELLDISRIEAGRLELKMEPVGIVAIIKEVAAGFESKIKEKGLELVTDLPAGDIEIYADPDKIAQVFTNLINNAVKFTDKGFIEVSVKETPGAVTCSVSDTGTGIPKEDLPNVFEKFRQFSRVAGPGDRGTGLGLSIVKGLVVAHKGNIWVESLPGKGAKFIFNLPKYNTESLLREYVNSGVESAKKTGSRMSLISVSVADFPDMEKKTDTEGTHRVLKEMRDVVAGMLRREGDTVIKYTGEIMVFLPNCNREGAVSVQKRIRGALDEYLRLKRQNLSIKLNFGCVTYPDDAEDGGGLVAKARKLALYGSKA